MTWGHLVAVFLAAIALWIVAEVFAYLGLAVIGDSPNGY